MEKHLNIKFKVLNYNIPKKQKQTYILYIFFCFKMHLSGVSALYSWLKGIPITHNLKLKMDILFPVSFTGQRKKNPHR